MAAPVLTPELLLSAPVAPAPPALRRPAPAPFAPGASGPGSWRPLDYRAAVVDGMQVLAYEPTGAGRVVEVLGDLATAEAVAVVVPGNAHQLDTYRTEQGGAAPRRSGRWLHAALRRLAPGTAGAVVVWLGYACPRGFVAGARRDAAEIGARDLARLTLHLPSQARITLIGHSYGSVVCAIAATHGRVDDLVALASPGLGVRRAAELAMPATLWAGRGDDDWVRFLPRGRIGRYGHGRQPTDRGYGARRFATDGALGHSGYYTPGSESLANLARIVVGHHDRVTLPGARSHNPTT